MTDKATPCETCNPSTGAVKAVCPTYLGGRCSPLVTCEKIRIKDPVLSIELGYDVWIDSGMCKTSPTGDCSDETLTVGTGGIRDGVMPSTNPYSDVAILENGYPYDMYKLLSSFGQDARIIKASELSPVMNVSLLIIPSGGLNGMENSEFFKVALDEYVKKGGKVLVLTQRVGYEFSVLPGGISGYGWSEDQSCFSDSSYVDTWHNVLAGQTKNIPSLGIDGYFTKYPENSIVLLRRTRNSQPAFLIYPYGNGYVIAGTSYTDWAYATRQASEDERRLIRDIVTWAKAPASLAEIKPGQTATINLTVTNNDDTFTSTAADIWLYDPDKNFVKREKFPLTVAPGASTTVPFIYTTSTMSPLGIYHIKYGLYTEDWILWHSEEQPEGVYVWDEFSFQNTEEPSGRFVVSNPPTNNPYKNPDFNFSVQSDAEWYFYRTPVTFTVIGWNNSNASSTITAKYSGVASGSQTITIPALSSESFQVSTSAAASWGDLLVQFLDETGRYVGNAWKRIYAYYPGADVTIQIDKNIYAKGETVAISIKNTTTANSSWNADLKTTITDPSNTKVFEDNKTVNISASGTVDVTASYTLPLNSKIGTYIVRLEVWYGTRRVSSASTLFQLPQSQISVTPKLPPAFIAGNNTISFTLNNTGGINVSSGTLDVSLKDPDGSAVYTGTQTFNIAVGETRTLNFSISIPSLKFGNYTLTYTQSDETRTGKPVSVIIPNKSAFSMSLDKPSYKLGETANITIAINNTGKFIQEGTLTIDIPFIGFTDTKAVTINSGITTFSYNISLPFTLSSGGNINAAFITSENQLEGTLRVVITPINIPQDISFDKPSYRIRENLGMSYTVTNDGNFTSPLNASFSLSIPDLNYTYNSSLALEPEIESTMPFNIAIPETVPSGQHNVLTSITLPSGVVYQNAFNFTVPEPDLVIATPESDTFAAGDTVNITFKNTGGVDASVTNDIILLDNYWNFVYGDSYDSTIPAGGEVYYSFQIPAQTAEGSYTLYLDSTDSNSGIVLGYTSRSLNISGLTAGLSVK
ncbi:MAG: hypothetical protein HY753_07780, partial [Nitrospirae bacterium]|nr:hypothetical protein [Nitrospirota bacterium]